jgi:hypothetical protein
MSNTARLTERHHRGGEEATAAPSILRYAFNLTG